ncbi:1,4-beta-xylanase [Sporosarcina sp. P16b]|uniref:polysaccharide deacetylase family protein n=1 Tax=Sporosarcina sp. P16b TaxID=2048261 RepID=UPI000C168D22|nr:polysaccharide deacetylase family protein [Sporosarcina sp. P16b]PIC71314.1 1,4-beta-xylanase [Sporosarcina sp. P16b]
MKDTNKRRRSSWIDSALIITIITLLSITLLLIVNVMKTKDTTSPKHVIQEIIPAPKQEVSVESIISPYPGIKMFTEIPKDSRYPFTIRYPQTEYDGFNKQVLDYVDQLKKTYANEQQKENRVSKLDVSFETLQHLSGNYSFVMRAVTYFADQDSQMKIQTFHINPETGEELKIEDIVDHNLEKLKRMASVVRDEIHQSPLLEGDVIKESVWQPTEPMWVNYRNYALTDDSLFLYFGTGEFTKRQAGPATVEIPLRKLNPFLAKEFQVATDDTKKEKTIALTFDDGPDPIYTLRILETLKKYNAKATFFMLGNRVHSYPSIAKKVAEAGHEIGNHSWNHPTLTELTDVALQSEVKGTSDIIEAIIGHPATVFRPPYGAVDDRVRESTKLPVVLWNVDTLDWDHHDPELILEHVAQDARAGSIILMHDIHESTADGLEAVLENLQSQGYKFVTVSEMDNY